MTDLNQSAPIPGAGVLHHKPRVHLNRRRAIRERCLDCSACSTKDVQHCTMIDCALYTFRTGKGRQSPISRNKAIRSYCLWCCGDQPGEVRLCPTSSCPLYSFRGVTEKTNQNASVFQKNATGMGISNIEQGGEYV